MTSRTTRDRTAPHVFTRRARPHTRTTIAPPTNSKLRVARQMQRVEHASRRTSVIGMPHAPTRICRATRPDPHAPCPRGTHLARPRARRVPGLRARHLPCSAAQAACHAGKPHATARVIRALHPHAPTPHPQIAGLQNEQHSRTPAPSRGRSHSNAAVNPNCLLAREKRTEVMRPEAARKLRSG